MKGFNNIMQGLDAIDDNILCFPSTKCEVIATYVSMQRTTLSQFVRTTV